MVRPERRKARCAFPPYRPALAAQWRDGPSALRCCCDVAAAGAAVAGGAAAGVLRLGRAGLPVLRRVRAAGTGGGALVDLCRAADPRIRLVAHRAVGGGVIGRRAGGGGGAVDRAVARPPRLAARVVRVGAGQRRHPDAAVADSLLARLLPAVLRRADEL